MTQKLYDTDSHLYEFAAKVLACEKTDNGYAVVLDRTAFFPEGGGQPADTGKIGDSVVTDVQIYDEIFHYTDSPLEVGREYRCALDAEKRFRRMQNHSGEHILSGIVYKLYGYNNVGFHMGSEDITVDYSGPLTHEQIAEVERLCNVAVSQNLKITAVYPAPAELSKMKYRSKLDLTENVRIVTVEGYDACACCAPHVSRTGEIGIIKLLDSEKNKGGTRIHLLCGFDALDDYNARYHMIAETAKSLSIKQNDVRNAVLRMEKEIADLKFKMYGLRRALIAYKTAEIPETHGNICFFEEELNRNDMREIMNRGMEKCGGASMVFCGSDETGYTFVAGSKNLDMTEIAASLRSNFGAKGGGSNEMIQGSVNATQAQIREFFRA